jgi:transcription-repair coupling factor (superfamily II helicase)
VAAAVAGGFVLNDGLTLITDQKIFGFRKQRRTLRSRRGVRSDLLSSIEVGDYLVHADHGIARFGGMVRRASNGSEREYLELQYAEGDRLLVPADNLDAITRYIGPGDHKPALTRLDSQDWARAKRRVRQSVLELAQDLIELYAKREVARGFAFPADHPVADGDGSRLSVRRDAGPDWGNQRSETRHGARTADGPAALRRRGIWEDGGRDPGRVQGGDGRPQVAVLVPTTVLAEQHGRTFRERTAGFPVRVEVLSRFRSDAEQAEITRGLASGDIDIVVGTHRLLQQDVQFKDLGLVIVDEEQRFGVSHKERLKKMREEVDVLTLSATPIPRTLQMSLVGIRDMSTVMTPPEERLPIRTYVTEWDDEIVREAIMREVQRGGQVYFVHNRVQSIEMHRRAATGPCAGSPHLHRSRPDARGHARAGDDGVRRGRTRHPGLHDDHRERAGHPEREHDHHQQREPARAGTALPAPWTGRPCSEPGLRVPAL